VLRHLRGAHEALAAGDFAAQFVDRKSKAIFTEDFFGIDGAVFEFSELEEGNGLDKRAVAGRGAFGLKPAELGSVLFEGALDALGVEGEEGEVLRLIEKGPGLGERVFGGVESGVALGFEIAEGEDVVLDGAGTIEAPAVVGNGSGKVGLDGAFGGEFFDDGGGEGFVRGAVFVGEESELAGEAVFQVVGSDALFAFGCAGAGGVLGVFAVGLDLFG